jgi:circadian clock protein KaiB
MAKPPTKRGMLRLRLYVSGNAPNSLRAIVNARAICEAHFASAHELQIIDMLQDPRAALADGIIVSPTLLRLSPRPVARMIGDLRDTNLVLEALQGS